MSSPILTVLSYSAGVQSHALLEMVLRGELKVETPFLVLNADPGMEDSRSYEFVARARDRCREAGIDFVIAEGPNLFHDLTTFKERGLTRFEHPPFWTLSAAGKKGRLQQRCTYEYKVAPMRRALRQYLNRKYGIGLKTCRLPKIAMWIGFAADETKRCKPSWVKYIDIQYPLIELGMDRAKVEGYYLKHGIDKPPRSVCNACFANGLRYFEEMYYQRPDDWDKAVAVDEACRDLSQIGIRDQCFVSSARVPLKDLPSLQFKKFDGDYTEYRCNSGVCFL